MAEVTSKINQINVDTSGRGSGAAAFNRTVFTATKVSGPTGIPPIYQSDIIRYSDAKGNNPITIGTRDSKTGKITFNDSASSTDKKGSSQIAKASTTQMNSPEVQALASNASQRAALNASAGQSNKSQGSGDDQSTPSSSGSQTPPPKTRKDFGGNTPLVFPEALSTSDRDVIKFKMMEYRPSGFGQGGDIGKAGQRKAGKIIGSAVLPIPAGISDTNAVGWGPDTMNPIQAAAANIAMSILDNDKQTSAAENAAAAVEHIKANNPAVRKGLMGMITGAATGLNQQALQRGEGMVMNPNMELLFSGPQLRSFGFNFQLSPRSPSEARKVVQIIRFFKQGMSVIRSEANFFLKAPHTFQLEYRQRGSESKYLNKFKECALQNCTVQYTPEGNYNTYTDGVMTSYSLQLAFNELEPVYNDDYENHTSRDAIGY